MRPFLLSLIAATLLLICPAPAAVSGPGARAELQRVYTSQLGIREATGRNDGVQVESYLRLIGLGKGYAWCSAFVVWCCRRAGLAVPAFGRARSWFDARHTIWRLGRSLTGADPKFGDLVGFKWGAAEVSHVGFLNIWGKGPTCETYEGNTSGGKQDRDGQGVFRNWRLKSQVYAVANVADNPKY